VFADGSVGSVDWSLPTLINEAGGVDDDSQLDDVPYGYYVTQSPAGVKYLRRRCDAVVVARRYPPALLKELASRTREIIL
jgi:hypothetical protein